MFLTTIIIIINSIQHYRVFTLFGFFKTERACFKCEGAQFLMKHSMLWKDREHKITTLMEFSFP